MEHEDSINTSQGALSLPFSSNADELKVSEYVAFLLGTLSTVKLVLLSEQLLSFTYRAQRTCLARSSPTPPIYVHTIDTKYCYSQVH